MKRFNDTPVSDFSYSDEPASLRDLENRESREIEEADFSAFSLRSEDTREALEDLRLGWGEYRASGENWEIDDSEFSGGADYVPHWA